MKENIKQKRVRFSLHKSQGFTLVEMVVVMVVVAILGAMTTDLIIMPVKSYVDLSRRTTLVNNVDSALRRMQRDIRQALPNSIRITGSGTVIEMLHTSDGGRYRQQLTFASTGDKLEITPTAQTSMDIIGALQNTPSGKLVINNTGSIGGNDVYAGDNITDISGYTSSPPNLTFSSKVFPEHSSLQHFFVVDNAVTYYCDTTNNQLLRYEGYSIASTQPNPPSGTGHVLVNQLSSCLFTYNTSASLVTLTITLTDSVGESVNLLHQVHVENDS